MKLYNYCRRCGKRLKGEENRLRGYGKICFQRARMETKMQSLVTSTPIENTPIENKLKSKDEEAKNLQSKAISKAKESSEQGKESSEQGKVQGQAQGRVQESRAESRAEQGNAEQGGKELGKSQENKEQKDKAMQSKNHQGQGGKGVEPPHLEKTLTPTYKKPLLFTPHTPPPPTPK